MLNRKPRRLLSHCSKATLCPRCPTSTYPSKNIPPLFLFSHQHHLLAQHSSNRSSARRAISRPTHGVRDERSADTGIGTAFTTAGSVSQSTDTNICKAGAARGCGANGSAGGGVAKSGGLSGWMVTHGGRYDGMSQKEIAPFQQPPSQGSHQDIVQDFWVGLGSLWATANDDDLELQLPFYISQSPPIVVLWMPGSQLGLANLLR